MPDPTEDDGGPCPVCDRYAGESRRCHFCDRCVHDDCWEEHEKAHGPRETVIALRDAWHAGMAESPGDDTHAAECALRAAAPWLTPVAREAIDAWRALPPDKREDWIDSIEGEFGPWDGEYVNPATALLRALSPEENSHG